MPVGKVFDEHLVIEFARRMNQAQSRADKGEALRWFIGLTGVSKSTAYNALKKINSGISYGDVAKGKQVRKRRKNDIEIAREKQDAIIVSGIKRRAGEDKKWVPTERAIAIAESMDQIEKGKYTRSTMDRLMKKYELNSRSAKLRPTAQKLTAKHPGHVFVVDATPIDHYYLRLDRSIHRHDGPAGDKHLDDILEKEKLSKIWVYYLVDMYSHAFLAMPFASIPKGKRSKNPGENSDDWLTFLRWCFMPKHGVPSPLTDRKAPFKDCPVEGVPVVLFSDKGSGIGKSSLIKNMCNRMGARVVTHMPNNPSAKGLVEGRIGAFKRSFESQLNPRLITDINQLIYFYQAWAHYWNSTHGAYDLWQKGVKINPIRRITEQNFRDASVAHFIRVIDAYGCVSIDNEKWFVHWDEKYRGTKVSLYRPPVFEGEKRFIAELEDNTVIECIEGVPEHDFENIKSYPISDGARNRAEAREQGKGTEKIMIIDDILPPDNKDENVVRMPSPAIPVETHSPVAPDTFENPGKAWKWILDQTGLFLGEISESNRALIQQGLNLAMKTYGHVPSELVISFSNLINLHKQAEGVNQ